MIDKISADKCCLCKACAEVCSTGAIIFSKYMDSFYYPEIQTEKCIACNRCEMVCPQLNTLFRDENPFSPKAYVAYSQDENIRKNASSGGAFAELAKVVLHKGGYVCGAVFKDGFHVVHSVSNKPEQVKQMCGSKYAQSDTSGVYKKVERLLKSRKLVMFTGCPCQIAGLRSYLGKEYAELLLVELICHGIPSDEMLQEYITIQEKKYKSKIKNIYFRDKRNGWHRCGVHIYFSNGRQYHSPSMADPYMTGFLKGILMKKSCYQCSFKKNRAKSDITLGDFWGAEVEIPELDDNKGLSAILTHSKKGELLLRDTALKIQSCKLDTIIKYNRNVIEPSKESAQRTAFFLCYKRDGIEKAFKQFLTEHTVDKIIRTTKYYLRCIKAWIYRENKPFY